jgi:hypothetical protein
MGAGTRTRVMRMCFRPVIPNPALSSSQDRYRARLFRIYLRGRELHWEFQAL